VVGFSLISDHTTADKRELAMATASVADTLGIMLADVLGLVVQGCLYKAHGIDGATYQCGK